MSRRTAIWAAWAVFGLTCALWVADLVGGYLGRSLDPGSNWTTGFGADVMFMLTILTFPLAGVLIASRRPGSVIGWLLLLVGVCWVIANAPYADYGLLLHPGSLPASNYVAPWSAAFWVPSIGVCCTFLLLLFPDGSLPSRRWRWVAYLSGFTIVAGTLVLVLAPGYLTEAGYPHTDNPYGIQSLSGVLDVSQLVLVLLPVSMLLSASGLVVRFRRAGVVEREQIKWLMSSAGAVAAIYAVVAPLSAILSREAWSGSQSEWLGAAQGLALISFALIPISILVAVLRYRLFDIDVIIRRTLTYAVLVAVLAAGYVAGIWLVGSVLRSLTGASGAVAVTLTTLGLWAVFQPLRRRIQGAVDRRFGRERYDAAAVLADLSRHLRDSVELETVEGELLDAVAATVQPRAATLWLRGAR